MSVCNDCKRSFKNIEKQLTPCYTDCSNRKAVPARVTFERRKHCVMKEIVDSIDSAVLAIAEAAFWGIVKRIINKVRLILVLEGETEGAEILDIIANK